MREPLDETGLIRLIQRTARERGRLKVGIGDDAGVLKDGTVITTDTYAEGVHFDAGYMTWRQVGARCACAALSDIAAMAAKPEALLVALTLTRRTAAAAVHSIYLGIEQVLALTGCELAGGDITTAAQLSLTLTAVGRTATPRTRSAARPGEMVYVTGTVGSAEAGRLVLKHGLPRRQFRELVRRHLLPLPRLEVIETLSPKVRALIDTSDGLGTDANHLARMSRVRIVLELDRLPIHPATKRLCARLGLDLQRFLLSSGEDYELLFTGPEALPDDVNGIPVTRIGRTEPGAGLYTRQGQELRRIRPCGYDHRRRNR